MRTQSAASAVLNVVFLTAAFVSILHSRNQSPQLTPTILCLLCNELPSITASEMNGWVWKSQSVRPGKDVSSEPRQQDQVEGKQRVLSYSNAANSDWSLSIAC